MYQHHVTFQMEKSPLAISLAISQQAMRAALAVSFLPRLAQLLAIVMGTTLTHTKVAALILLGCRQIVLSSADLVSKVWGLWEVMTEIHCSIAWWYRSHRPLCS